MPEAAGDEAAAASRAREAATREILEVISRSRDAEGPVFDAILRNAARLCDAGSVQLHLVDAERTRFFFAAMEQAALALKGIKEPVAVWRVTGQREASPARRPPVRPTGERSGGGSRFAGRLGEGQKDMIGETAEDGDRDAVPGDGEGVVQPPGQDEVVRQAHESRRLAGRKEVASARGRHRRGSERSSPFVPSHFAKE